MSADIIELDGSQGEGGGQILRTSLTLSLLTGKPFHLRHIRARRSNPGLQPQHLMSVRAAATIGQAAIKGDQKLSQDLTFEPGTVVAGKYHFSIGTAGATSLVLQTIYLPLALRGDTASHLTITGGTHVKASPCYHFLDTTWRAYLERLGIPVRLKMRQPGFYPRGGGIIEAEIDPARQVKPLRVSSVAGPPDAMKATGFSAVAGLPEAIAERQARRATTRLKKARLDCDLRLETWPDGPGTVLGLILQTQHSALSTQHFFYGLGERGKPAERVADDAVDELLAHVEADATAVDPHSADQLVLPLAMAEGRSEYRVSKVTRHLLTNIDVVRRFVPREIVCEGEAGERGRVVIA